MMRGVTLTLALFVATIEPIASEPDVLVKYAITQGGLLAVVLVLLFFYRRDFLREIEEQRERLSVMAGMVESSTQALTRSADASERMARAVEHMTFRP